MMRALILLALFLPTPAWAEDKPLPADIVAVNVNLINLQNAIAQLFALKQQLAGQVEASEVQKATLIQWLCDAQHKKC